VRYGGDLSGGDLPGITSMSAYTGLLQLSFLLLMLMLLLLLLLVFLLFILLLLLLLFVVKVALEQELDRLLRPLTSSF
jgi:hypothetical protein